MHSSGVENPERRNLLRAIPAAAAAGLMLTDVSLFGIPAAAQTSRVGEAKYEVISASQYEDDIKASKAHPGNKMLYRAKTFTIVLTTETNAIAQEFEWHEHRDHIFNVVDGTTTFELGGTPQNAHSPRPGEWLAPASQGAVKVTLHKGDRLIIPRGTPHKRDTAGTVTFTLTAPTS
jgi:quercetin dioxygenase-like cupin family protein